MREPSPNGFLPRGLQGGRAVAFARARHDAHRTGFEAAIVRFRAVEADQPNPLAVAYQALVGGLLGHDPAPDVERARADASELRADERTLVEAIGSIATNDLSSASEHLERFTHRYPRDPYARHARGFTQLDLGNFDQGVQILEELLADQPDFVPALNHLSYGFVKTGRPELAITAARAFTERDPTNPSALDSLADILMAMGNVEGALEQLRAAVEMAPGFAYGWYHLGTLHEGRGDIRAASSAYERAITCSALYGPRLVERMEQARDRTALYPA